MMQNLNRFFVRMLCAVCLSLLAGGGWAAHAQDAASELFSRVNNLRASVGRGPYAYNGALAAAAQDQANWMLATGSVSHTRPDGSGPRTRALNAGYPSTTVGENIYIGGLASVDTAWTFWVNSGVHYNGMVNAAFTEMGVGVAADASGAAFVLVFGNSGGPPPPPANSGASAGAAVAAAGNSGGSSPAQSGPPAYFAGVDANGNILHVVQQGDTLGDIALIYGYNWDDLPRMMAANNLTDVRDLEVGSMFLVPPRGGTFTPTPGGPTNTPTPVPPTQTPVPASITPYVALMPVQQATLVVTPIVALTVTLTPTPTETPGVATAAALPEEIAALASIAATSSPSPDASGTPAPASASSANTAGQPGGLGVIIAAAVAVQVAVLAYAGAEYVRRGRRK
ncbi:MAG: LysM peptidoglycan-binding domain-containing protein [Pleurocapsa minor GSE-CHR-MK-17-07R]|jgi:hypothetical protein|nr:LysM peptidoglycan-binding domain-containing protein [Pleurocapsa minor GSE-CHR-MK 17-07R]